ncbi:hypothetical protein UO65_6030 [Actinokineospora spheciospongiae]|uniref:DUF3103 family protein n=1 Tax=Actinokineospora spheciospongiae TaxID=909613 RepID=W7IQ87_9PSEU|nr:DUF3103 family protein [Actinokineospora spheciospongiae]EWC58676.1 hypothetical protein UO65_6030 [Actinokineospora spheciospongiae]
MGKLRHGVVAVVVLASGVVAAGAAQAAPARPDGVGRITDRVAHALAVELGESGARPALGTAPADPRVLDRRGRLAPTLAAANADVLTAKGLPAGSADLLRVRLGDAGMAVALRDGVAPLVAAAPNDDEATRFTAYEPGGRAVTLSTVEVPSRPVFVVDIDVPTATRLGLDVLRRATGTRSIQSGPIKAAGGYWATQVTRVRVGDNQEPWPKGSSEIFTLAGGFGPDGKATVDPVQMPYLDDENRDYHPNQLLVHWNHYRYNAADVVMMEDDGDTNYSALATALATALLTIVDGGAYTPLVTAILNAMPASWWVDDPDYVESWYTLTTQTSGTITGARGTGVMDVRPYWVEEL